MTAYRTRFLGPLLEELLRDLPALLVVGPRATGRTTTAARHAATIVQLDHAAQAAPFEADADAALLELDESILLDEWQVVPSVLGEVKRAVNSNRLPGRFLLTGSVRADIDAETSSATGRVRLDMYPLTVAEQVGSGTRPLVDRLMDGEKPSPASEPPDLRGYVELPLRGGFPEAALGVSGRARERWLDSYVDQLLTRDALSLESGRDPQRLARFFEAYALNSAGVAEDKTIYDAAGINRKTAVAYLQLLKNLLVIDELPSWASNRMKRLVKSPKRYLIDSALLGGALGVDVTAVLRDGDSWGVSWKRSWLPSFERRRQWRRLDPRMYHLRQEDGRHEVDIVAEIRGGGAIAVEVKASSAPTADAARHLVWLGDHLGDSFVAGAVLHTGPATYSLGERLVAAPICTLWS